MPWIFLELLAYGKSNYWSFLKVIRKGEPFRLEGGTDETLMKVMKFEELGKGEEEVGRASWMD